MNSARSHVPLLRSLARRLAAVPTIDMALLAELGLPTVRKDACKVQAEPGHPALAPFGPSGGERRPSDVPIGPFQRNEAGSLIARSIALHHWGALCGWARRSRLRAWSGLTLTSSPSGEYSPVPVSHWRHLPL
jgi:hypothetical protein